MYYKDCETLLTEALQNCDSSKGQLRKLVATLMVLGNEVDASDVVVITQCIESVEALETTLKNNLEYRENKIVWETARNAQRSPNTEVVPDTGHD